MEAMQLEADNLFMQYIARFGVEELPPRMQMPMEQQTDEFFDALLERCLKEGLRIALFAGLIAFCDEIASRTRIGGAIFILNGFCARTIGVVKFLCVLIKHIRGFIRVGQGGSVDFGIDIVLKCDQFFGVQRIYGIINRLKLFRDCGEGQSGQKKAQNQ